MMLFENYLEKQIRKHPSIQPQDVVKLCYQAAFGAEHLLSDLEGARAYFNQEYSAVEAVDQDLYEQISEHVCRINLAAWKFRGLPAEWLFQMFAASASVQAHEQETIAVCAGVLGSREKVFSDYLLRAEKVLKKMEISFTDEDWQDYLTEYEKSGVHAVHHSAVYRECEKPAYRIVNRQYIRLLPILEKAAEYASVGCGEDGFSHEKQNCVIVIDGRAASGKSTMASQLKQILGGEIVQMDDFFLPAELRTRERLQTPGGNVHYERFMEEVLPYISKPGPFSYRRFDCSEMDYNGERQVPDAQFRIVEGSYSCHPLFGEYGDITVFSDVEPEEQMNRILTRNGSEMAEMFRTRWIPMEEMYFKEYKIPEKAMIQV